MRILHSRKLILISKPRSGSTSLRQLLDKYITNEDIKCDVPYEIWHPHHTAECLRNIFEEKGWDYSSYIKICTSRNPYDLLVSYYSYFEPDIFGSYNFQETYKRDKLISFKEWILTGKIWDHTLIEQGNDVSTIGVEKFCYDSEGRNIVDFVCDIHNLKSLEKTLGNLLNDSNLKVPHINKSKRAVSNYQTYYDEETKVKVEEMFKMEFELFDYIF